MGAQGAYPPKMAVSFRSRAVGATVALEALRGRPRAAAAARDCVACARRVGRLLAAHPALVLRFDDAAMAVDELD
jgi:hypothetical protein